MNASNPKARPSAGADGRSRRADIAATLACATAIYWLFDGLATRLGSLKGESGLIVCALVLAALVACECLLSGSGWRAALKALGLLRIAPRSCLGVLALYAAMLGFFPVFTFFSGTALSADAEWMWLLPGLFAQGGLAEETLFRGFVFRRLRARAGFGSAAMLAMVPFALAHVALFSTLSLPVALAATLLAVATAFPLSVLFEKSGGAVWPGAILHVTIQAGAKLFAAGAATQTMMIGWMAISAVVPVLAVFGVPASARFLRAALADKSVWPS